MVNGGRWKKQGLSGPPRVRKVLGERERGGQDGGWRWGETRTGAGFGVGGSRGVTVRFGAPGSGLGTPLSSFPSPPPPGSAVWALWVQSRAEGSIPGLVGGGGGGVGGRRAAG